MTDEPSAITYRGEPLMEDVRVALAAALRAVEVRYVGGIPEGATDAVAAELLDAILTPLWRWKKAHRPLVGETP